MTVEDIKEIGIPCDDTSEMTCLMVECAVEWLAAHTTLQISVNDIQALKKLPSSAKLFIIKYIEISNREAGVASESLGGLSQSFDSSTDNQTLIWSLAEELLSQYLKSRNSFIPAKRKWR